ncbi:hypothetical protein [Flavivirga eckloniae]|uniref:Cytochrome b561 bacterial/Ni-hydrogenase domain-containing protein n=1 Tax=Flavivirga eckloniae TaxID=1803846 RepID=A0A2K9PKL8_9FLAO|nr:hypothetical protein [Flavivirga eckloniae]AUP77611.1 hypothetical protein C1H87_02305 [Flavivirga eckloniae]
MVTSNKSTILGVAFLALFFLQYFLQLEWNWLLENQQDEMYKRWSGLAIALLITCQWLLTVTRVINKWRPYSIKMATMHKWLGALSPVFFYAHSMHLGYGYLLLLSYVFLSNALLGYINLDVIKNNSDWLFKGWMIAHVAFSIIVSILMFFHIGAVFYYK